VNETPWKRVEDLYHAALEYAPGERDAFLSSACGDDVELRREVESLLSHSDEAKSLFEQPAWEGIVQVPWSSPNAGVPLSQGALLGPYRIERLIGRAVWARSIWPQTLDLIARWRLRCCTRIMLRVSSVKLELLPP